MPCHEVNGFAELLQRFERNISILGRSPRTFDNYSRHIVAMALRTSAACQRNWTKTKSKTISTNCNNAVKLHLRLISNTPFTDLRFMLKGEGLPYSPFIFLLSNGIKTTTVLSKAGSMANAQSSCSNIRCSSAYLLATRTRCMEVRNIRIWQIWILKEKLLHIRQSKGRKDRMVP